MRKMYTQIPAVTGGLNLIKRQMKLGYLEDKPTAWGLQILRGAVIGHNDIVQYAAKACNAPANDVDRALTALLDACQYFMNFGHGVQIDGLGTFKITTQCGVFPTLEALDENDGGKAIKRNRIMFYPSQQMQRLCSKKNVRCTVIPFSKFGKNAEPQPEP